MCACVCACVCTRLRVRDCDWELTVLSFITATVTIALGPGEVNGIQKVGFGSGGSIQHLVPCVRACVCVCVCVCVHPRARACVVRGQRKVIRTQEQGSTTYHARTRVRAHTHTRTHTRTHHHRRRVLRCSGPPPTPRSRCAKTSAASACLSRLHANPGRVLPEHARTPLLHVDSERSLS